MRLFFHGLALVAGFAWGGLAFAQQARFTPAAEFYFDEDPRTARLIVADSGEGDALVAKLLKLIERNPRNREATAQLAHVAMAAGRLDLGHELYRRVLAQTGTNDGIYRPLLWNYGWDLYRTGDAAGALAQWETLARSRGVTAAWMPPTLALALWAVDRREEAVAWYAAAVRTQPELWSTPARFDSLLPDWGEDERALLVEVQRAWQDNPPGWP